MMMTAARNKILITSRNIDEFVRSRHLVSLGKPSAAWNRAPALRPGGRQIDCAAPLGAGLRFANDHASRGTREVGKVELPELRLRNGLLLLITLRQPVKHDGVEVDIWIHNVVQSTFRFRMRVPGARQRL
jgi:hypothetical protein